MAKLDDIDIGMKVVYDGEEYVIAAVTVDHTKVWLPYLDAYIIVPIEELTIPKGDEDNG